MNEKNLRELAACLYILGNHDLRPQMIKSVIQHLDIHAARKFKQWCYHERGNTSFIRAAVLNVGHVI